MKVAGRMFVGAEEWCTEKPWLICRKKEIRDGGKVAEEAGCACFECWPKEVRSDTRVCIEILDLGGVRMGTLEMGS
jgi:hypothetical protein